MNSTVVDWPRNVFRGFPPPTLVSFGCCEHHRSARHKMPVQFSVSTSCECVHADTHFPPSFSVVSAPFLPEKQECKQMWCLSLPKKTKDPPPPKKKQIQHYTFSNLFDSCPVFKDVDVSQHVDDERSWDSHHPWWGNQLEGSILKKNKEIKVYLKPWSPSSSSPTDQTDSSSSISPLGDHHSTLK